MVRSGWRGMARAKSIFQDVEKRDECGLKSSAFSRTKIDGKQSRLKSFRQMIKCVRLIVHWLSRMMTETCEKKSYL